MKRLAFFLVIGLLVSGAVFAQTTQGVDSLNTQNQGANLEDFAGGGYNGPALVPVAISDLVDAAPNAFVIVEGYLIQRRVPGTFVLADAATDATVSVVVYFNDYAWANLDIGPDTPVLVYGIVNRSDLRIEIEASRIEIQK